MYGSDRPGIVARVSALLATHGVNITDLSCRLAGAESPVYVMVAELSAAEGTDLDALGAEITARAGELGVDAAFRPIDVDTL